MKICRNTNCKNTHDGSFGGGLFCSRACANSRVKTKAIKEKTSDSLKRKFASGYKHTEQWHQKIKNYWANEDNRKKHGVLVSSFYKLNPQRKITFAKLSLYKKRISGQYIKKVLINEGIKKDICEKCGQLPTWNGQKLVLQLNHKDGDKTNNLLNNLEIICPNCHTQTENFASKNKRRYKLQNPLIGRRAGLDPVNVGSTPASVTSGI